MSTILTKMFCRIQNGRTLQKKHICMQNNLAISPNQEFQLKELYDNDPETAQRWDRVPYWLGLKE